MSLVPMISSLIFNSQNIAYGIIKKVKEIAIVQTVAKNN